MRSRKSVYVLQAALLCGLFVSGCSKKSAEADGAAGGTPAAAKPAAKPGKEVLPGASDVRAAMAQKDYNRAVGGLMALQHLVVTEEQRAEYGALMGEVRGDLMDLSTTDRKAADALMQLRTMRSGR